MRRSTRISTTRKPIEIITISSSEDENEPLPRQQDLSFSDCSDSPLPQPLALPAPPTRSPSPSPSPPQICTPPRAVSQPVRSSSTDPRPAGPRNLQSRQQRSNSQPASEPRIASARRRFDSSSSDYSPTEGSSSSSSSSSSSPASASSSSSSSSSLSESAIRPPKRVPVLVSSTENSCSSPPSKSQARARVPPAQAQPDVPSAQAQSQPNVFSGNTQAQPHVSKTRASSQRPPEQDPSQTDCNSEIEERAKRRKLALDKIIGAVKHDGGIDFVVKWKGLTNPEKIPLKHLRVLFPREVVDFMCTRIKWLEGATADNSGSQRSTTGVT